MKVHRLLGSAQSSRLFTWKTTISITRSLKQSTKYCCENFLTSVLLTALQLRAINSTLNQGSRYISIRSAPFRSTHESTTFNLGRTSFDHFFSPKLCGGLLEITFYLVRLRFWRWNHLRWYYHSQRPIVSLRFNKVLATFIANDAICFENFLSTLPLNSEWGRWDGVVVHMSLTRVVMTRIDGWASSMTYCRQSHIGFRLFSKTSSLYFFQSFSPLCAPSGAHYRLMLNFFKIYMRKFLVRNNIKIKWCELLIP